MALIRHGFLPRSMFNMDSWLRNDNVWGPSTLDLFDPFDDLDRLMGRNLMWVDMPSFLSERNHRPPKVPNKYRVTVDCRGYNADSIKTEIKEGKLLVRGQEGEKKNDSDDYSIKEFRKTYKLPENVEADKMVSFITGNGKLVVEIPLKEAQVHQNHLTDDFPRIVEGKDGSKSVNLKFAVPANIDPSKIQVTCKDRDIIVQAEEKLEKEDGVSQTYYYRRSTLPETTNFDDLKCVLENNHLSITAPIDENLRQNKRKIPIQIEGAKKQEALSN